MLLTMWEESVWECCEVSEDDETGARHVSSGSPLPPPPFTSHHPAPRLPVCSKNASDSYICSALKLKTCTWVRAAHTLPPHHLYLLCLSLLQNFSIASTVRQPLLGPHSQQTMEWWRLRVWRSCVRGCLHCSERRMHCVPLLCVCVCLSVL